MFVLSCYSTSAAGAAKNTARSILDDEDDLNSASSEETGRYVSKDPEESSVRKNAFSPY